MSRKNMLTFGMTVWLAVLGGFVTSAKASDYVFTEYGKR
jgi:hypothetical protein